MLEELVVKKDLHFILLVGRAEVRGRQPAGNVPEFLQQASPETHPVLPLAGEPEIDVSFDIDANGIVNVSARDANSGAEQSISVNTTGTLSDEEIQRILAENAEIELPGDGA